MFLIIFKLLGISFFSKNLNISFFTKSILSEFHHLGASTHIYTWSAFDFGNILALNIQAYIGPNIIIIKDNQKIILNIFLFLLAFLLLFKYLFIKFR